MLVQGQAGFADGWDARGKERKIRVYLLGFGLGQVDKCSAAEVDKTGGRTGE